MTDRGEQALQTIRDKFRVGPSEIRWEQDRLVIEVDEYGAPPLFGRIKGRVTLTPSGLSHVELPLHSSGRHIWRPFAPTARIDVDLNQGWQWSGHGYFDANFGTSALEDDFSYWTWGRFPLRQGSASFYDVKSRDGGRLQVAAQFDEQGHVEMIPRPPQSRLKRNIWALRRTAWADEETQARVVKSMLEAPFYSRCAVETQINGHATTGVYEALDLDRFATTWIKPMLALRVPRIPKWRATSPHGT